MSKRFRHLEIHEQQQEQRPEVRADEQEDVGTPRRTAEHDMRLAVDATRLGRFETALQLYTRALRESRGLIPAWVGQVQMLIELGEPAEARLWCDKALELFRNNGELLAVKARACARLGDRRAAMACSDAALASPGSSPARWQARGEVLLARDARRARDCFERSLAETESDWFDRVIIARIHLYYDRATAALEHARAAVGLKPSHVYCWYVVGQCQEAIGWFDQAEESYERCLELAGDYREASVALDAVRSRTFGQVMWRRLRRWLPR
ncbi:MAG: tetratricopeptide repeat protein [Planctomycetota bacterium]